MKLKEYTRKLIIAFVVLSMITLLGGIIHTAQPGGQPGGGQPAAGDQGGGQQPPNTRPADDPTRRRLNPGQVEDQSATNLTKPEDESLYTIIIDDFERSGEWRARMPIDQGIVKSKELWGAPSALRRAYKKNNQNQQGGQQGGQQGTDAQNQQDRMRRGRAYFESEKNEPRKILGVRVDYMQRGYNWFTIEPPRPINLDGQVKAFEVWVCGRNQRHELYIMILDFDKNPRYIKVGMLNFIGWKRMTAPIPYTIKQSDFRKSIRRGVTFTGFLVRCHPMETSGKYYVYLDNFSVEISRFLEENRDRDDPLDIW
jgi:hypothetical protein